MDFYTNDRHISLPHCVSWKYRYPEVFQIYLDYGSVTRITDNSFTDIVPTIRKLFFLKRSVHFGK